MAAQTTNLNYCAFFMASAFVSYEPLSTLPRERCIELLQLFRQWLSHKSVKAYATMPIGIMGRKSLALND